MKTRVLGPALGSIAVAVAATTFGQVVIRGADSTDGSATHSEVTINTPDRNIVPLIKESKDTKVDSTTQRTESVTRARLNDGSYFEWQREYLDEERSFSPDKSVSSRPISSRRIARARITFRGTLMRP